MNRSEVKDFETYRLYIKDYCFNYIKNNQYKEAVYIKSELNHYLVKEAEYFYNTGLIIDKYLFQVEHDINNPRILNLIEPIVSADIKFNFNLSLNKEENKKIVSSDDIVRADPQFSKVYKGIFDTKDYDDNYTKKNSIQADIDEMNNGGQE